MGVLDRFSLSGRVGVVTGGAGPRIGKDISAALAEAGATVVVASRSLERNRVFVADLCSGGYDAHAIELDICDLNSIGNLHDQVLSRFGRLDILVNSARVGIGGDFDSQAPDDWLLSARGDMVGLFALCRSFIPDMVRQGRGSVINIASIYGVVSNDPSLYQGVHRLQPPHYSFIKAGMINFTRYLANHYGRKGVRANCISPGGYFDHQPEAFVERYCQRVPIGRMLNNEDIKGAVVFLASDASEYVTGINLMVDGGWTAV